MQEQNGGEGVELSPRDIADLETLTNPSVVRHIAAYSRPDEPTHELMRETWIQGQIVVPKELGDEALLRLDHGAGLGNARLSLIVEIDGERVAWEYIDVTTLVEAWATSIVDDLAAGNTAERDRIAELMRELKKDTPKDE